MTDLAKLCPATPLAAAIVVKKTRMKLRCVRIRSLPAFRRGQRHEDGLFQGPMQHRVARVAPQATSESFTCSDGCVGLRMQMGESPHTWRGRCTAAGPTRGSFSPPFVAWLAVSAAALITPAAGTEGSINVMNTHSDFLKN